MEKDKKGKGKCSAAFTDGSAYKTNRERNKKDSFSWPPRLLRGNKRRKVSKSGCSLIVDWNNGSGMKSTLGLQKLKGQK